MTTMAIGASAQFVTGSDDRDAGQSATGASADFATILGRNGDDRSSAAQQSAGDDSSSDHFELVDDANEVSSSVTHDAEGKPGLPRPRSLDDDTTQALAAVALSAVALAQLPAQPPRTPVVLRHLVTTSTPQTGEISDAAAQTNVNTALPAALALLQAGSLSALAASPTTPSPLPSATGPRATGPATAEIGSSAQAPARSAGAVTPAGAATSPAPSATPSEVLGEAPAAAGGTALATIPRFGESAVAPGQNSSPATASPAASEVTANSSSAGPLSASAQLRIDQAPIASAAPTALPEVAALATSTPELTVRLSQPEPHRGSSASTTAELGSSRSQSAADQSAYNRIGSPALSAQNAPVTQPLAAAGAQAVVDLSAAGQQPVVVAASTGAAASSMLKPKPAVDTSAAEAGSAIGTAQPLPATVIPPALLHASVAAPAQSVPVSNQPLPQQLSEPVLKLRAAGDGIHRIVIDLHPHDLGPVNVEVRLHNGEISVSLLSGSEVTRATIAAALPQLQQQLSDAGMTAVSIAVDSSALNSSGSGTTGGQNEQAQQQTAWTPRHTADSAASSPSDFRSRRATAGSIPATGMDRWL